MTYVGFERTVAKMEYSLSTGAAIPVLGSIAGAAKVILGIIQTIGALLALIVSIPFLGTEGGRELGRRAGSHVVNGMANIIAGALEGIPLLGTVIFFCRQRGDFGGSDDDRQHIITGQDHAIIVGYRILQYNPSRIGYHPQQMTLTRQEVERLKSEDSYKYYSPLLVV